MPTTEEPRPNDVFDRCLENLSMMSCILKNEIIEREDVRHNDKAKAELILYRIDEAVFWIKNA